MASDLTAAWFGLAGTVAGSTVTYLAQARASAQEWKVRLRDERRAAYGVYLRETRPIQSRLDEVMRWTMEESAVLRVGAADSPEYADELSRRAQLNERLRRDYEELTDVTSDLALVAPPNVVTVAVQIQMWCMDVHLSLDRWVQGHELEDDDLRLLLSGRPDALLRELSDTLHNDLKEPWIKPTLRRRLLFRLGR
jgi:hypothetical protein